MTDYVKISSTKKGVLQALNPSTKKGALQALNPLDLFIFFFFTYFLLLNVIRFPYLRPRMDVVNFNLSRADTILGRDMEDDRKQFQELSDQLSNLATHVRFIFVSVSVSVSVFVSVYQLFHSLELYNVIDSFICHSKKWKTTRKQF